MSSSLVGFTDSPASSATFTWAAEPMISFITVTYGTSRVIDDCLTSLAASLTTAPGVCSSEMIVVDNPHPTLGHRTADRLALSTSGVQVVRPQLNLGFGGGNELGVLHARGDLLCFVNPDLVFSNGWLEPMVECVRRSPESIIAPRLRNADGSLQEAGQQLLATARTRPILATDGETPVDYASAACWMMTRSLHERSGGFDPRFHPAYFEDVDLALRVRRLGGSTRIADADIVHLRGGSTAGATTHAAEAQRSILIELWSEQLRNQPAD